VQQPLRDAPNQEPGHGRVSASPDDDHVAACLTGGLGDHVRCAGRGGGDHLQRRVEPRRLGLLDLVEDLLLELLLVGEHRIAARPAADEQLLAVHGDQLLAFALGEGLCIRQRAVGGRRPVRCPKDRLEHDVLPSFVLRVCAWRGLAVIGVGTESARVVFRRSPYHAPVEAVTPTETRLRAVLEVGMAISSELSLDVLLQRVVEAAAALTGARYAALGVLGRDGSQLERFLTTGIDPELQETIGELPRGRGVLGVLIRDTVPLRLHDLSEDPRSVGFPPGHPPMRTFLGVPVFLRGIAYGNLYLTEKVGGEDFTDEDQEIVTLLAGQAAVAIENARLYEATTQWSNQLESLNEIGNALATETDIDRLLDLVARRLRELLDARLVVVLLPAGPMELRFVAVAGEGGEDLVGRTMVRAASKSGRVLERGRSERSDAVLDDPEVDREVVRRFGARTGLWVPLVARGRTIGLIAAHDKLGQDARFSDNDLRLAETFASRAAVAVDLSQRIARDALRRVVDAQELERRRLARELHDETGQALTSILLGLRAFEETLEGDRSRNAVSELRELVVATLQDVRRLAVELRPKVLDDFGLVPALERLTETFGEQTGIKVRFEAGIRDERLLPEAETALYRIVQEALTNIVKHAQARNVSIVLTRKPGSVVAVIEDDGQGFDPAQTREGGFGIEGMRERVGLLDGRLEVESSAESGTTLVAEVPVT
jgi:signal transduction histidine kinase